MTASGWKNAAVADMAEDSAAPIELETTEQAAATFYDGPYDHLIKVTDFYAVNTTVLHNSEIMSADIATNTQSGYFYGDKDEKPSMHMSKQYISLITAGNVDRYFGLFDGPAIPVFSLNKCDSAKWATNITVDGRRSETVAALDVTNLYTIYKSTAQAQAFCVDNVILEYTNAGPDDYQSMGSIVYLASVKKAKILNTAAHVPSEGFIDGGDVGELVLDGVSIAENKKLFVDDFANLHTTTLTLMPGQALPNVDSFTGTVQKVFKDDGDAEAEQCKQSASQKSLSYTMKCVNLTTYEPPSTPKQTKNATQPGHAGNDDSKKHNSGLIIGLAVAGGVALMAVVVVAVVVVRKRRSTRSAANEPHI